MFVEFCVNFEQYILSRDEEWCKLPYGAYLMRLPAEFRNSYHRLIQMGAHYCVTLFLLSEAGNQWQ